MHDQVLMHVLHRRAHLAEQRNAFGQGELVAVAVLFDRCALHIIHHEVGLARWRGTAIQQGSDVQMVQGGQDLPFVPEAAQDLVRIEAAARQLRILEEVARARLSDRETVVS